MKRRFLTADWRHLAMLNYEVDPDLLRPLVPAGTELDDWNGKTFASVIGFLFLNTRVLGVPVPFHRDFEEVNLRFYVRRRVGGEVRRGVVFVKEIVPKRLVAAVARWAYNEGYVAAPMDHHVKLPDPARGGGGVAEFGWGRGPGRNFVRAEFAGEPHRPAAGSPEEFITEHYWGYVRQRRGPAVEYAVAHPQWRVWPATAARLCCDVAAVYGRQYAAALSREPASAFVAEGSAVTVFRGGRLGDPEAR